MSIADEQLKKVNDAAEKYAQHRSFPNIAKHGFIAGANWALPPPKSRYIAALEGLKNDKPWDRWNHAIDEAIKTIKEL